MDPIQFSKYPMNKHVYEATKNMCLSDNESNRDMMTTYSGNKFYNTLPSAVFIINLEPVKKM